MARCIAEGLVGGVSFAVDASLIKADANRQPAGSRLAPPTIWTRILSRARSTDGVGVTPKRLKQAVKTSGPMVKDIAALLGKKL